MASLTSFLPNLTGFGLSVPALYERQRALVRLGHLPAPKGRGRGAGVEASPKSVALLFLAVAATDNLSDTDRRIRRLVHAESSSECMLTGEFQLARAVEVLLAKPSLAERVEHLIVSRSSLSAHLYWSKGKRRQATLFGTEALHYFDVSAYLSGQLFVHVGGLLNEADSK